MKAPRIIAASVITASLALMPAMSVLASYYPADRQTYTCETPTKCVGADHVTFNSFTNNPVVGDERAFFAGSLNGANVADRIKVKNGDTIVLRAYVHNNADATKMGGQANTVAKNVKVKVIVPTAKQNDTNLIAFISATNANPGMINDTMSVYAKDNFAVSYVPGSAKFQHAADGTTQKTVSLSDDIVKGGASLGDLDGCFAYSGYVTLRVKVSMPSTPTTPVTPTTPTKETPAEQTPAELPKTGADNTIAAGLALSTLVMSAAYVLQRRNILG